VPRVGWTPYREYRLWRHHPEIRFSGRIHESIVPAIHAVADREGLLVSESDVLTIDHLGYEGDQTRKHLRNEPMLRTAIEDNPDRIFYYDHLARIYEALGDDARAVETWMRGIEVARARGAEDHDDRLLWIGLILHKLLRDEIDDELAPLVGEALERFP